MSWLRDYLSYTENQESPTVLHLWTGITTIASVLDRRIWVNKQAEGVHWYRVYPGQLMCILVTPPGKGHKGAAMREGRKLMEALGVNLIKGKGSTEGLIAKLSRTQTLVNGSRIISGHIPEAIGTIYAAELSVMLSKAVYAESMIDFLTDLYDADGDFPYSLAKSEVILHNPCATLLAGATPDSIGDSIPEKAHGTGFSSRVLYIYHSGDERPPNSLIEIRRHADVERLRARKLAIKASLTERLNLMRHLAGEIEFVRDDEETDRYLESGRSVDFVPVRDAAVWYDVWHNRWKKSKVGQLEGYPARKPDHLLRIAQILAVSEAHPSGVVAVQPTPKFDIDTLDAAKMALEQIEPGFALAFSCIGQHRQSNLLQDKVLKALRQYSGSGTTRQILSHTIRYFRDKNEFTDTMETLVKAGLIRYDGVRGVDEWWSLPSP